MRRLACMLLVLAAAGCAPVTVPDAEPTGFAPIGEGAAEILQAKANELGAEMASLAKQCASLEKRRATLVQEAKDYRARAIKAKRSPYLSDSQKKAKYDLWTDLAMERNRQVGACDKRLTTMNAHMMYLKMRHQTVLREARQAEKAVVPAPG